MIHMTSRLKEVIIEDATKEDYEEIMNMIAKETGLDLTLEFHYKFLVLLHVEADEKVRSQKALFWTYL